MQTSTQNGSLKPHGNDITPRQQVAGQADLKSNLFLECLSDRA
jgi:hypothetical protein